MAPSTQGRAGGKLRKYGSLRRKAALIREMLLVRQGGSVRNRRRAPRLVWALIRLGRSRYLAPIIGVPGVLCIWACWSPTIATRLSRQSPEYAQSVLLSRHLAFMLMPWDYPVHKSTQKIHSSSNRILIYN